MVPDVSKDCGAFRSSGTKNPVTGHHVPEDMNPNFNSFIFFLFYQNEIYTGCPRRKGQYSGMS
jgi:hypothetical protein